MPGALPIHLFTDYGPGGPYVGLLHAALRKAGFNGAIIDLQHDAPTFAPVAAGYLLEALLPHLAQPGVVVAVVDPGVGGERQGLVVNLPGQRLVGPDNGLFAPLLPMAVSIARIAGQPPGMSATFHGRDWFAPVGARLAEGGQVPLVPLRPADCVGNDNPASRRSIIYCDGFGNAMTGVRAAGIRGDVVVSISGQSVRRARTFGDVPRGEPFWYANSLGLVELAVNQGSAMERLGVCIGDPVSVAAAERGGGRA
jgi:S-adenosylmethionine hydrolase